MERALLATESFSHYRKHYFFDFMQASNGSHYLKITRSDQQDDDTYKKQGVVIFEENFALVFEALSSLFRTAYYQQQQVDEGREVRGIKSWDPQCRPREKMTEQGRSAMSDTELLAMLIGSGFPGQTAVDLASRLLNSVDFNLWRLSRLTVPELCTFRGIGYAKSSTIVAAMEFGKRLAEQQLIFSGGSNGNSL